jgi:hypothetical protein
MVSAVLQLAIGIVLVFFLLGSVCSYLNELVAAVLDRRAAHLEAWIQKMLGSELAERFFLDPRIVSLQRPRAGQARRSSEGVPELATEQTKRRKQAADRREQLHDNDRVRSPSEPAKRAAEPPAGPERRPSRMASLRRPERRVPSYLSSETFATVLLSVLELSSNQQQPVRTPRTGRPRTGPGGRSEGSSHACGGTSSHLGRRRRSP